MTLDCMAIGAAANGLRAILILAAFSSAAGIVARAQSNSHPAESSLMRQVHQALTLDEHGDKQGAMNLVLRLLEQHPDFAPAIKLKGMLLEEAGLPSEAAGAYEQALRLAPNDADLLLKTGIYRLAAGQKEEALKLLRRCVRILPGDGDAQYYLAQAYHLNVGRQTGLPAACRQSLKGRARQSIGLAEVWRTPVRHGRLRGGAEVAAQGTALGCHAAADLTMTLPQRITN